MSLNFRGWNYKLKSRFKMVDVEVKGRSSDEDSDGEQSHSSQSPGGDLFKSVQMLPKFDEKYVEAFFISFDEVAKQMKWPVTMWVLLIPKKL
eukprot:g33495.t1